MWHAVGVGTGARSNRGFHRASWSCRLLEGPFVRFRGEPVPAASSAALAQGCILATNHRSIFDAFTGFAVLGRMGVTARPVSSARLWDSKVLGRLLDSVGAIAVGTGTEALTAVDRAVDHLNGGEVILVTPEGRIVPAVERVDGVGAGTKLISRIANAADVEVIPAAMTGTDAFWPLEQRLPRLRPFRPVEIRYALGEPLRFGRSHRDNVDATMSAISTLLRDLDDAAASLVPSR